MKQKKTMVPSIVDNDKTTTGDSSIRLLCLNDQIIKRTVFCKDYIEYDHKSFTGEGLVKGKKYTSSGLATDEYGLLCYRINEINGGDLKLVERFKEIEE